ncbi:hypothetical protein PR202_ga24958 [Eleusine coracana subsp. coracana]|uniref:WRKY domain-containing protein n=1 Tax=Eleusine coracana subsp. coracana TaxID=191504 RepID=A0AAV5D9U2_ELECO|nr:hypothetical protein PR202_ga24958 [Eleusine coracana subsp. coracana]
MKQRHHPNNSRVYPPGQSPASDDPSHVVCDHRSVMKEITKEQSLVTQLRAIVLPALQADERSELVAQMFQNILDCSSKAMAELQLLHQSDDARNDDTQVDDKKRLRMISDDSNKEDVKPHHKHKREGMHPLSLETPVPHYDGRQWRKYGQKKHQQRKNPRSYYRCTYRQEQDCKATKTVQQKDQSIGSDHPVMYTVVYHGQHTCKGNNCSDSGTDDSETKTTMQSSSDSQQSSISGYCSDPFDHQRSLDGNKLVGKSEDVIAENNIYQACDMTAFASLEFDSWELDVLLRFGA